MKKIKLRKGSWIFIAVSIFAWFANPSKVVGAELYEVHGATDFYFYWTEPVTLQFRTYAWQYSIDSMLWLYNEDTKTLVASNDDYYSLDSYISYDIEPNTIYRIRAGVCCGNPDVWYGNFYYLEVSNSVTTSTPNTEVTTTIEESTTTTEQTTTTEEAIVTTSTVIEETTTTEQTRTTELPTTTVIIPTTSQEISTTSELTTTIPIIIETTSTTSTTVLQTTSTVTDMTSTTEIIPTTSIIDNTTTSTEIKISDFTNNKIIDIISNNLETFSNDEIKEIFQNIDISSLTPSQEQELIKNINNQSDEIKTLFESEIDVFGNGLDEYIPSGSLVNVGTRRVIIAATAAITVVSGVQTSPDSNKKTKR